MDRKPADVTYCFQWDDDVVGCTNLVENQILKYGLFSNNTTKHFSQREILRCKPYSRSILANISSTKQ